MIPSPVYLDTSHPHNIALPTHEIGEVGLFEPSHSHAGHMKDRSSIEKVFEAERCHAEVGKRGGLLFRLKVVEKDGTFLALLTPIANDDTGAVDDLSGVSFAVEDACGV